MSGLEALIVGVSVWGPGLEGWAASLPVLAGLVAYAARPSPAPAPELLPANERRRTGPVVRLALTVAQAAAASSGLPPARLRSVFGSANGDGPVVGSILGVLAGAAEEQARVVSPTAFHNSVHNAAAGYWSIATGNPLPATCLGAYDSTWAATLLTALVELRGGDPVLAVAYDHPMPPPYDAVRPMLAPFGAGLVLLPPGSAHPAPLARLRATYVPEPAEPAQVLPQSAALRPLATGNPAGRSLRLLEALARGAAMRCDAPYLDGRLEVSVDPCSTAPAIAALLPHAGAMSLLGRVIGWDAAGIRCAATSHLDPGNPLRRAGTLPAVCGLEYPLQAAALHGALTAGSVRQPAGVVASLRDVALHAERLDDPALGELLAVARLERAEAGALAYALELRAADGRPLLAGRAVIALPRAAAA